MYGFNPYSAAPYSALSGGVVVELTGVVASGLVGNEIPNFVAELSGVSATGTVADVIAVLGVSLTGVSASGSAGTVTTFTENSATLFHNEAFGFVGTIEAAIGPTVAGTGVFATGTGGGR